MNARFNLPDFLTGRDAYSIIVKMKKDHPEVFYPNTEISAIFGNFPACIWNGGGVLTSGSMTRNEIEDIIGHFNYELNLPLRFTFTNVFCTENQTFDTYANIIAECGNNGKNQILVVNGTLEKYLREHYKNYKYCRSIIAARDIPYSLHGPFGDYFLSVMRRNCNNDWEYLDTIPIEDRTHIEFLCTDPCPDNCPRLYTHYRDFARCQSEFKELDESTKCSMWDVKGEFLYHFLTHNLKTYISRDMIDNEYLPKGFNEFKISGRLSPIGIVFGIANYMILPEYKDDVLAQLLNTFGLS